MTRSPKSKPKNILVGTPKLTRSNQTFDIRTPLPGGCQSAAGDVEVGLGFRVQGLGVQGFTGEGSLNPKRFRGLEFTDVGFRAIGV